MYKSSVEFLIFCFNMAFLFIASFVLFGFHFFFIIVYMVVCFVCFCLIL